MYPFISYIFSGLLESFSTILYDSLRPLYIRSRNIEMLCQVVYLLKTEISVEQLEQRGYLCVLLPNVPGDSVVPFKAIVRRMIQDVQERLTFLAQTYIRDEIAAYVPSDEDLDYPKKLAGISVAMETY